MNERMRLTQALEEGIAVQRAVLESLLDELETAAAWLAETLRGGGTVLFFGNGGSAADCQHLAAELVGRFERDRPALAAIALTTNTSVLTAIANDLGYEQVFARQVEAVGRPGDLALAFSTSGSSANVVAGVRAARARGLRTIALTGEAGGEVAREADLALRVPSRRTARVQEAHIAIGHALCEVVEAVLA